MNLLNCIYHLGLNMGWRYWKLNRYYRKHPAHFVDLIQAYRQKAIQEPNESGLWNSWADQCEKSYQNYLARKNKNN